MLGAGLLNLVARYTLKSGGQTAALHMVLVAVMEWVLPVGRCFTLQTVRVSVFSRTAIHAPGGWALIENLPHVLTGDRVTVGISSAYLLPQRQKLNFPRHRIAFGAWIGGMPDALSDQRSCEGLQFEAGR